LQSFILQMLDICPWHRSIKKWPSKPCEKMTEAIVVDGGKRGQIVKVCSDPNCRVHHPDRPSPQKQSGNEPRSASASSRRNSPSPSGTAVTQQVAAQQEKRRGRKTAAKKKAAA